MAKSILFWLQDKRQQALGNSKKLQFVVYALSVLFFALRVAAEAQQPQKIPRIGFVSVSGDPNSPGHFVEAFRLGLRDLGYIEGKNILIEYRYASIEPARVPDYVTELVQLKVDVLLLSSSGAIHAAKQATKTIPIVIVTAQDPVDTGIVDSLARPGGNITGLTRLTRDLSGRRMQLFKEAVAGISRVGLLAAQGFSGLKDYESAARAQAMQLQYLEVRGSDPDLEGAFREATKSRLNALIMIAGRTINRFAKQMVDLPIKNRLPAMYETSGFVEAGGLMSYSSSDLETFRRAAWYVDKVLKGTKPADLPVERPTKFEFVINLKTAKAINLTIPQSVLYRADRVIR